MRLCGCFLSLSLFSRFIHMYHVSVYSFLSGWNYPIVCYITLYLPIHPLLNIWIVSTFWAIEKAAMKFCVQILISVSVFNILGYLEVTCWSYSILYLTFWRILFGFNLLIQHVALSLCLFPLDQWINSPVGLLETNGTHSSLQSGSQYIFSFPAFPKTD